MLDGNRAELLRKDFLNLLDEELSEQKYQDFLEHNTELIPREFLQNHGVHFDLVVRKLSLGGNYTTDFFYMSKSSGDWNLVFVEIEKPQSRYFKNAKGELHVDFLKALDQISRWRIWFDNPSNRNAFIDNTIAPIRVPVPMRRNPCHLKYVLVHGRRNEFEGNEVKTGLIRSKETNDFKILSYDSLVEALNARAPLYVSIRRNEYFDIVSPVFAGQNLFIWVERSHLRINDALRKNILDSQSALGFGVSLSKKLQNIGRCP
ncbi:MAG: Shedu immune nuclease family protein [Gammaproteobacteria bacterium]